MRRCFTLAAAVAAALLVTAAARPAAAGGFAVPEIGTRKTGMGAVVGKPDDLSAVYHNPAGLTLGSGTRLYLSTGLSLIDTNLRIKPWKGSDCCLSALPEADGYFPETTPSRSFAVIPMLVASTNVLSERLALAVALYVPNAAGAAFPEDSVARYHLVDAYAVAGYASVGAAYRVLDWLSVGATFSLIYMKLHAERFFFPIVTLNGKETNLKPLIGDKSRLVLGGEDLVPAFSVGVLLQPLEGLSFGMTLLSRGDMTLEGDAEVIFGEGALSKGSWTGTQSTTLVIPWTLQWGVNWDINRWVEVGLEYRYWFYSAFVEQRTTISGELGTIVPELVTPKNYKNSWQLSGGVRVTLPPLPALELMLGLHYDVSPAPDNAVSPDQPSFFHLGIHSGARYTINETFRVALTYARYIYFERTTSESVTVPPSNFIGGGGNNIFTVVLEARLGDGLGL